MATFRYKAVRGSGEMVEGEMTGASRAEIVARLSDTGLIPIRAEEAHGARFAGWLALDVFGGRRIAPRQVMVVTRGLATLLQAGIELDRALEMTIALTEDRKIRDLLATVRGEINGGRALADALEDHAASLPPSYVGMVRAGEAGGALDVVFARLADLLERSFAAREAVRSALVYPVLLLVMAVLSVVVMVAVVLPQFTPMFAEAGRELPWLTRAVLGASDVVERWGAALALALLAALLLARQRLKVPAVRRAADRRLLRVPLAGPLIVRLEVARLARTLGTLLQNGVPTLSALAIARETLVNRALAAALERVAEDVKGGASISDALAALPEIPALARRMIAIGEETGRLEEMLLRTADIYEQEAERAIQRLLALLLPTLTALLGLLIAAIVGSIFLAIVSVNELAF